MPKGRPPICIYCGKSTSISKGVRRTKSMGVRRIRLCKSCGRKFTPRKQKLVEGPAQAPPVENASPIMDPPAAP